MLHKDVHNSWSLKSLKFEGSYVSGSLQGSEGRRVNMEGGTPTCFAFIKRYCDLSLLVKIIN